MLDQSYEKVAIPIVLYSYNKRIHRPALLYDKKEKITSGHLPYERRRITTIRSTAYRRKHVLIQFIVIAVLCKRVKSFSTLTERSLPCNVNEQRSLLFIGIFESQSVGIAFFSDFVHGM